MDVDSLVKLVRGNIAFLAKTKGDGRGKGKGGKPSAKFEGTCDLCGKYGHKRKDCRSKDKSGGKGTSSSRSASTTPQKEKFTGKCNHCGKAGHKKAEWWVITGKGKGKSGCTPKPKAVASVESHPEPAAASGLELCSLEVDMLTVVSRGEDAQEGAEEEEPTGDNPVEPNETPSRRPDHRGEGHQDQGREGHSELKHRDRGQHHLRAQAEG